MVKNGIKPNVTSTNFLCDLPALPLDHIPRLHETGTKLDRHDFGPLPIQIIVLVHMKSAQASPISSAGKTRMSSDRLELGPVRNFLRENAKTWGIRTKTASRVYVHSTRTANHFPDLSFLVPSPTKFQITCCVC